MTLPLAAALFVLLPFLGAPGVDPQAPAVRDGQHDFDFYVGAWKLHNRRLKDPLSGSTMWYEFEGTAVSRPVWGGKANLDEIEADTPSGHIQGLTLALYDPATRLWSLYWVTSAAPVPMGAPIVGSFRDGRGTFYDKETYKGRPIVVRNVWSGITPGAFHWEQAFSADGGATWETNWVTDATRVP